MKRLTEKRDGKVVIPLRNSVCGVDMSHWCISKESDIQSFLSGDAADRLAAYEDTGMEPEEIKELSELKTSLTEAEQKMLNDYLSLGSLARLRELAEADRDGRCVVLPCEVGDTVWTNFSVVGSYLREKDRPYACKVLFIGLNQSNSGGYINIEYVKSGYQFPLDFDAFGKTVFLTLADAEKALEAQK